MSAHSKISWTDHTFNIAWGCQKISPGCKNCYADDLSARYGHDVFGPGNARRIQQAGAEADVRAKRYHEAMTALQARCNELAADVARLMKRTIAEDFEALKIVAAAHGV